MKNQKRKLNVDPKTHLQASLSRAFHISVEGYRIVESKDGGMVRKRVSLAEQLRGVKAMIGTEFLSAPVTVTLKTFNSHTESPAKDSPRGLGVITSCPVCGSKKLKDESGFIMEGVSCKSCGWSDMDAGIDSGC